MKSYPHPLLLPLRNRFYELPFSTSSASLCNYTRTYIFIFPSWKGWHALYLPVPPGEFFISGHRRPPTLLFAALRSPLGGCVIVHLPAPTQDHLYWLHSFVITRTTPMTTLVHLIFVCIEVFAEWISRSGTTAARGCVSITLAGLSSSPF